MGGHVVVIIAEWAFLISAGALIVMYIEHGECVRPLIGRLLSKRPMIPRRVDAYDFFEAVATRFEMPMNSITDLQDCYRLCRAAALKSWFRAQDLQTLEHHRASAEMTMRLRSYFSHQEKNQPAPKPKLSGWRKILKLEADERDVKRIKTAYRKLVSKNHPDKGGDGRLMGDYNQALEAARSELKFV